MNKYENLYVINAELTEEEIKSVIEKFAKVITDNGGEIEKIDEWGKRRLALKCGVICISEVIDTSGNPDSILCFIQSSISHDVLCI